MADNSVTFGAKAATFDALAFVAEVERRRGRICADALGADAPLPWHLDDPDDLDRAPGEIIIRDAENGYVCSLDTAEFGRPGQAGAEQARLVAHLILDAVHAGAGVRSEAEENGR